MSLTAACCAEYPNRCEEEEEDDDDDDDDDGVELFGWAPPPPPVAPPPPPLAEEGALSFLFLDAAVGSLGIILRIVSLSPPPDFGVVRQDI
jgi:hypothetical protein